MDQPTHDYQLLLDQLKTQPEDTQTQNYVFKCLHHDLLKKDWFKSCRDCLQQHPEFLEDAVQIALSKIFESFKDQGNDGAYSWLKTTFRRTCIDLARQEGLVRNHGVTVRNTIRKAVRLDGLELEDLELGKDFIRLSKNQAQPRTQKDPTQAGLEARLAVLSDDERNQLESLVLDGFEPPGALLDKIKPLCS